VSTIPLKFDLHVHTNHSPDGFSSVKETLKVAKLRVLNGLAITDHDTTSAINEALKLKGDLVIIPGAEISTENGHLLALGLMETIQSKLPMIDTIEKIHELSGIAVVPHPCMLFSCVDKSILEKSKIDAIEVINSKLFPFHNKIEQSKRLAEQLQKPQTAGSDAHLPLEIGNAYAIIFSKSIEVDDILHAIKQGKTEVYGSPTPLILRMRKLMLQFLK
jgi:hypothetical protein